MTRSNRKRCVVSLIILVGLTFNNVCFAADDPVSSFKAGVARLEDRKANIFGTQDVVITCDIKRTDSLLNPMLGILRVKHGTGSIGIIEEFYLSYSDGKWAVTKFLIKMGDAENGDSPGSPVSLPDEKARNVQSCFN